MSGVFQRALQGDPLEVPPVWLMRQAGRYHAPYQRLRAQHGFEALCRTPELAAEVAMAPVLDFDFDAAILFSDLLFPLEALGFGLSYDAGPPQLDGPLTVDRLARFRPLDEAVPRLAFQRDALAATRERLSADKGLIGFVGGPWTLFVYAVEGTHLGALERAKASLDLYRAFADRIVPLLVATIRISAGAIPTGARLGSVRARAGLSAAPGLLRQRVASRAYLGERVYDGAVGGPEPGC
jgi:uroporphyrinogen decarboxylase